MSLDVSVISQEQVLKIFAKGEGHFSDMKSQQIQPGNLTKTLSAFANADGGELYIGIDELNSGTYQWNGFTSIEEANGHLQALEEMFPLSTNFKYSFLRCDGLSGAFLYCEIDKTADIRYASNKIAYLRRGAQNLPQDTAEKLDRLKYGKGASRIRLLTASRQQYPIHWQPSSLLSKLSLRPNQTLGFENKNS
jgi:ATP-dependent DNA helicase RecG